MNHPPRRITSVLAVAVAACTLPGPALGGELDAGPYRLIYDDALGLPTRSLDAGIATYTFASYSRSGEFAEPSSLVDRFSATLSAAPDTSFNLRPDASPPVWAEARVDAWSFSPNLQPPPEDSARPYPEWASGTDAWVHGAAPVTLNGVGGELRQALVRFETVVGGMGAFGNAWYGVGCNYNFPDPCTSFEWVGYSWGVPVHVEGTFTPLIHVDERFVTGVPEPSTLWLALFGLGGLAATARTQRHRRLG